MVAAIYGVYINMRRWNWNDFLSFLLISYSESKSFLDIRNSRKLQVVLLMVSDFHERDMCRHCSRQALIVCSKKRLTEQRSKTHSVLLVKCFWHPNTVNLPPTLKKRESQGHTKRGQVSVRDWRVTKERVNHINQTIFTRLKKLICPPQIKWVETHSRICQTFF